jgi:hypothetical protein
VDSIESWKNVNVEALRVITRFVIARGGFVTAEHSALEHDITRLGGFNAGTGIRRDRLYCELEAILEEDVEYIRRGLATRQQLIEHDIFPFQQFGRRMFERYRGLFMRQMFRLQVAFQATLPDQVWVDASVITYPRRPREPLPAPLKTPLGIDLKFWGLDHAEIKRQESDSGSPFSFVKRMFVLRANEEALGIGTLEELPTDRRRTVFAGLRTSESGTKHAVTVFNFAEEPCQVEVFVGENIQMLRNYLSDEVIRVHDGTLSVQLNHYGFKILQVIG